MPEAPLQPQSPLQRLLALQALELAAKLEATAAQATRGETLADGEALLLQDGRQFLRDCLAATLQQQVQDDEKKGAPPEPVRVDTCAATRAADGDRS